MFMAYSVLIGVIVGFMLGGRIGRLADFRLRWAWLAVAALVIQVVLFTEQVNAAAGDLVPIIYVASSALVLAVIVRNLSTIKGLGIVALGACSNLAAIVANGGYMPATPEALGISGPVQTTYQANSMTTPDPVLGPLIDRFSLPGWLPYSNVFSIGDVLISIGIVVVIVMAMRRRQAQPSASHRLSAVGVATGARE